MKNLGTKIWKIFDEQKFFYLKSPPWALPKVLTLGNIQNNLVFPSLSRTFAPQNVKNVQT